MAQGFQVREISVHLHARLEVKLFKYDFNYPRDSKSFDYIPVHGFRHAYKCLLLRTRVRRNNHPLLDCNGELSRAEIPTGTRS